jgi:hypothetical protein
MEKIKCIVVDDEPLAVSLLVVMFRKFRFWSLFLVQKTL